MGFDTSARVRELQIWTSVTYKLCWVPLSEPLLLSQKLDEFTCDLVRSFCDYFEFKPFAMAIFDHPFMHSAVGLSFWNNDLITQFNAIKLLDQEGAIQFETICWKIILRALMGTEIIKSRGESRVKSGQKEKKTQHWST